VSLRIATAPVSWGIWEQTVDRPDLVPPEIFLQTIVDAGYTATETGPPGYFAPDGAAAAERARRYDVRLIASFLPLRLDDEAGFADDLATLDGTVEVLEAAGDGGLVLLAAMETAERARAAGSEERRLATGWDDETFDRASERLQRAADIVRGRGLGVALHQHAASHIESERELEEVLARTDIDLCVDTGHCVIGNCDPVALVKRHPDRLRHVHLKDVDGDLLERLQRGEVDMDEAWPMGIFCELGRGVVPLGEFLALPEVRSLDGWAAIEQDRVAVTTNDLPTVREADGRNRAQVAEWLS
jgi:inosose dehydratase